MIDIRAVASDLDPNENGGISISVLDFKGQPSTYPNRDPSQVLIYVEHGKLQIRVWTGQEDPTHEITIDPAEPADYESEPEKAND